MKFRTLIAVTLCAALAAGGAVLAHQASLPAPDLGAVALLVALAPVGIVTFGADVSPMAYQGEDGRLVTHPPLPRLALHDFQADTDGRLVHSIDGQVRAIVMPEGLEDYGRTWPAAAPLIAQLRAADHGTFGDFGEF